MKSSCFFLASSAKKLSKQTLRILRLCGERDIGDAHKFINKSITTIFGI